MTTIAEAERDFPRGDFFVSILDIGGLVRNRLRTLLVSISLGASVSFACRAQVPTLKAIEPGGQTTAHANNVPHLERRGSATQLIVDGGPFLVLGGELHNSSSSSVEFMKPVWPRLAAMHLKIGRAHV